MSSFAISLLSRLLARAPETSRRRKARSILARPWRGRLGSRARPRLESLEDRTLLSPYLVTTTADSGPGSLRDAITQIDMSTGYPYASASDPSRDEIDFNITAASDTGGGYNATTGVATITPQSAFPAVTNSVLINGYTQPGAKQNTLLGPGALGSNDSTLHPANYGDNAVLKIELNGANAGNATGLVLNSPNTTVQGLVINRFAAGGISVYYAGGPGDVVQGNFLGTNVTGTQALGNSGADIYVNSGQATQGATIGGTVPAARNIISGSQPNAPYNGYGIAIGGGAGNYVEGNFIGTDVTGTQSLGNAYAGISLGNGVTVGGLVPGAGNVISGNSIGIDVQGPTSVIEGNYVGTNVQGTGAIANGYGEGFFIRQGASGVIVGGTASGAGNLISGNGYGIRLHFTTNVQVQGNLIGTDCTGRKALGNQYGIYSQDGAYNNIIGGTSSGAGNVISGSKIGVLFFTGTGSGNVIEGNFIGTDITGTTTTGTDGSSLGNVDSGVAIWTSNNTVGGTAAGSGNIISGTKNDGGVVVLTGATGVAILGDSIHDNPGGGIDVRSGANNNQASPVLTSATGSASGTTITGTLQSVASTMFRVEFFADTPASGQGRTYLGFTTVTTNSSGAGNFTFTLTTPLPAGQTILSATATKLTTNLMPIETSGFALDVSIPSVGPITAPLAPVAVNTVINVSASFTDAFPSTTHTAVWNWGDSTTSTGTVTESSGSGTVTGSHSYAADGVYTVTLTVTNNLGGSAQSVFQYVVAYNPSAGFVTGGGWITSPAGAYAANPSLTGQANFGFNAKYQSGSTVPMGSTQFQFPAANLTFQSTSYDWLVITTNQAQYQGSGTINGAGNFGFLVTAQDNGGTTPDKLRLKIWDKNNNNAVVYDTQPGAPTTAAPTTPLGGGRIQVHTNAQLVAGGANASGGNVEPLTPEELQPIVQEAIARWAAAGIDPGQLSALSQVTVGIADFPGPWLGMAFPGAIWIDQNAAGYGWYVNATEANDAAFPATPSSPAYGKVDLLTVVAHELGHELGLTDTADNGLMGVFLTTGTRRLPVLDQLVARAGKAAATPMAIRAELPLSVAALLLIPNDGTAKPSTVPPAVPTVGLVPQLSQLLVPSAATPANDSSRSVAVLDALFAQLGPDPLDAAVPDPLASATAL